AVEAESPAAGAGESDLVVEHVSEPAPGPSAGTAAGGGEIETFDGTIDFDIAAHAAAKAEGLEVQEDVELEPQPQRIEGLATTPYESAEFVPAAPPPAPAAPPAPPPAPAPEPRAPARAEPEPPAAVRLSDDDGAADTAALSRAEPVL